MIYTTKQIYSEPKLIEKLDFYLKRIDRKQDVLILVVGSTGYGKTTITAACMNYLSWKSGREYTNANIFFNPDLMLDFAGNNKDKLIHWDEAVMGALSSDWQNKVQKKLLKMLWMSRKKRHIYFLCLPRFQRLKEDIIDKAMGMIRVYSPNEIDLGFFVYYNKKGLDLLYEDWKKTKKLHWRRYYSFHGRFTNCLSKIIDEDRYNIDKDAAILSILKDTETKPISDTKLLSLQYKMSQIPKVFPIKQQDLAKHLGVSPNTLINWAKTPSKVDDSLGK